MPINKGLSIGISSTFEPRTLSAGAEWHEAAEFANRLSELENRVKCYSISGENVSWTNKSCTGWRLPTEAEWEYAARGNEPYIYSGSYNPDAVGWYKDNVSDDNRNDPTPCTKKANGFGLCDMSGLQGEWVWDFDGRYGKQTSTVYDPTGPEKGNAHVIRSGRYHVAWNATQNIRVSARSLGVSSSGEGFRLVRLAN